MQDMQAAHSQIAVLNSSHWQAAGAGNSKQQWLCGLLLSMRKPGRKQCEWLAGPRCTTWRRY
jgi:hypothetical protein